MSMTQELKKFFSDEKHKGKRMGIAVKHSYRFMKIHSIIFSEIMLDYKAQESLVK